MQLVSKYKVLVDDLDIYNNIHSKGDILEIRFYNDHRLGHCSIVAGPYTWFNTHVGITVSELSYWIHVKKVLAPCH